MSNEAHIQFESMTGQVVDSCKRSSYALLFNGLQRLVARVDVMYTVARARGGVGLSPGFTVKPGPRAAARGGEARGQGDPGPSRPG